MLDQAGDLVVVVLSHTLGEASAIPVAELALWRALTFAGAATKGSEAHHIKVLLAAALLRELLKAVLLKRLRLLFRTLRVRLHSSHGVGLLLKKLHWGKRCLVAMLARHQGEMGFHVPRLGLAVRSMLHQGAEVGEPVRQASGMHT